VSGGLQSDLAVTVIWGANVDEIDLRIADDPFQSVLDFFQPSCSRALSTFLAERPQIVCRTISAGKSKNFGAWRQAFECAFPMKL